MEPVLEFVKNLLKYHKKKFFIAFVSFFIFVLILFPFGDLADLVTVQVSKATRNQVYLQFDDMGLSVLPSPGVSLTNVQLDTPQLPTIKTSSLSVSPNIAALLSFKRGFSARAEGFLKGDVRLHYKAGEQNEKTSKHNIDLVVEELDLSKVNNLTKLPIKLKGLANLDLKVVADDTMRDQPEGELTLLAKKVQLPPSTVPTTFGPMALPELKLSDVVLQGRITNGEFIVDEGNFGGKKDALSGRIKGRIAVTIKKNRGNFKPYFGGYDFKVELTTLKAGQEKFGLFLGFINNQYKTKTNTGFLYKFKVTGSRVGAPPRFSALGKF